MSLAGSVRLVPLERLSALVVIAAQAKSLGRIEAWIDRLDKPGEGEGEQVYVYEVQHGRASDLASVLGELFDIRSTSIGEDALLAPGLKPIELSSTRPLPLDQAMTSRTLPMNAGSIKGWASGVPRRALSAPSP